MPLDSSRNTPVVLFVASEPMLRHAMREALAAQDCDVVEESAAYEGKLACRSARPALVLLECGLDPDHELAVEFGGAEGRPGIPWIAVGSSEQCQEAVRRGALDWIVAPVVAPLLLHRVESVLRGLRIESDAEAARLRLTAEEAASETAISGPAPREEFLQRADAVLRDPRQRRSDAAMLFLSIEVEDGAEDAIATCLPTLSKRLRDVVRAREGSGAVQNVQAPLTLCEGHEFAVLLERQERPQDAYKVARRLQQQLERPVESAGRKFVVHVNVGIAVHRHDGASANELLDSAYGAMERARQEQLHGIRFATATMNASTFERLALESNLRYALEREELTLFYQPRIDLSTGGVVGFEALLRWKHPELGMVSPGQFIPIAEESGLIVPIGEWVLREACRQNQAWRAAGLRKVRMAVNLSSVQFRQPDLELRVARVLEETGLDPDGLELELTESMLLQDADATIETLRTMKHMGIHLSIDDFGTGYSSLSYIKRFPVDALKIDQSFVREVLSSPEDSAITTSIVLMGKSLNLTVVAEGVETKSQLEFLRVLECDEAQGYLFSRPVTADQAEECLRTGYAALLGVEAAVS
ncbi:MAG: EAL domain-containing protein [Planctomycetota bacterium]|nr:EAL domain-containing protein [Planctomycetota bacterium]